MRTIEATQFSVSEFLETLKNNTVHKNPFRNKGMELLKQQNLDPKSELNLRLGGLDNVVRIRVMKDMEDESKLSLTFNLKSPEKEVQRKRHEVEVKKEQEALRAYPLYVPDARGFVLETLKGARKAISKESPDLVLPVEPMDIIDKVMEHWGDGEEVLKSIRTDIITLADFSRGIQLLERSLFQHYLLMAVSMMNVYIMEYQSSSKELVEFASTMWRLKSQDHSSIKLKKPPRPKPHLKIVEKKDETTVRS